MKITFFGAAQTVTGSRIQFEYNHYKGLVDCGLFQGPKELRELNWNPQPELCQAESVLLTHAHIDHSGFLPKLCADGFRGPIFTSIPTADLLPVMLADAAKLQEEDAKYANRSKHSHHDPALPLYTSENAKACQEQIFSQPWNQWRELTRGLSFQFRRAGHILGAASIQLSYTEGDRSRLITFSGDLGSSHSDLQRPPDSLTETDYLVVESTYGNRTLDRSHILDQLAERINTVFSRGGTLLIPAFSVGRTQEIAFLIHQLKREKRIPQIPVYVDSPMSHTVTQVYLKHLEELKDTVSNPDLLSSLASIGFKSVLSADESMLLCMSDEPKIVVSASGMLQGGRILHHLKMKLPSEKNAVLFMGFQSAGTKGRLLKEGLRRIRIHHQEIEVEAEISSIEGLSAHADSQEIMQWLKGFVRAPQQVFINHGELESSRALAKRIESELGWKNIVIPEVGKAYHLKPT